jgi:signal transduction histidine kinase
MQTASLSAASFDTRALFRAYSAGAAIVGLALLAGVPGLGTDLGATPEIARSFLQVSGVMLFSLACLAGGFGEIEDPPSRHRALGWFAFAHLAALAGIVGISARHGGVHRGDVGVPVLVGLCVVLFHFWQTGDGYRAGESLPFTKRFGSPRTVERLRSEYEARIREAAGQEERHRLARELHDSVKQQIYAIQAAAATVEARFDSDAPGARAALDRLRESGREAMAEMEAMLDSLRATTLTNAGLVEALKKQGEALQFRTGARVAFEIGPLPPDAVLAPGAQQAIFKVAQEAFANIGRHARATHATVRLALDGARLVLRIEDDGAGFVPASPAAGMGLANMRERAAAYGADFEVRSQPGAGTTVVLSMPSADRVVGDLAHQRRRSIAWGLGCAAIAAITLAVWLTGSRPGPITAILAANVIIFLREAFSYRTARRRAEEAAWTASPSRS